jgi:hypothetical protein
MLPLCKDPHQLVVTDCVQSTSEVHLTFSTNYLPPGFFVRLLTAFSKKSNVHIDFNGNHYSNAMRFVYGHPEQLLDELVLIQNKSSISIKAQRVLKRSYKCPLFVSSCHEVLLRSLPESVKEVEKWFPGIECSLAIRCESCSQSSHFVPLKSLPYKSSTPTLLCQGGRQIKLSPEQFWFCTEEVSILVAA